MSKPKQAAAAAAEFADGHVNPAAPITASAPLVAGSSLNALREAEMTALVEDALVAPPAAGFILVVCRVPGFRRAGLVHPARAEYPLDFFTAEQLEQLRAEPQIEVVAIGGTIVPRFGPAFGDEAPTPVPLDPLLAGQAAAAAVSGGATRATPGLRGAAVDGYSPRGRTAL